MFTIDAASLTAWQACRRRYLLSTTYHPRRWRPRALLSACLRDAVYQVSNGADAVTAAKEARARFMETAAGPGIEADDPYRMAKDCCAVMDVVVRCVPKLVLLTVKPAPHMTLDVDARWRTLAWADDSGALHRWVFTDRTDHDRMLSETHSWYVAGDVMLGRVPMTLHFVELGQMRQGRLRSPWTQAYHLPAMRNTDYHFRSKHGHPLRGAWETKYLADDPHADVDEWAERCWAEGAALSWMQHVNVKVPDEAACEATTRMVRAEAAEMRMAVESQFAREWWDYPMARAACDGPFAPCAWQAACYSTEPVSLDNSRLFIRRESTKVLLGTEAR